MATVQNHLILEFLTRDVQRALEPEALEWQGGAEHV